MEAAQDTHRRNPINIKKIATTFVIMLPMLFQTQPVNEPPSNHGTELLTTSYQPATIKLNWPTPSPTPTPTRTPSPTPTKLIPGELLDDRDNWNGYWWYENQWVPGLPTYAAQFLRMPDISTGVAVLYAPEVMEANVIHRGVSMEGMVGAVAVPFCSEIGHTVWLKRPGYDWEGPFMVADCTRRNDLYGVIVYSRQVVEVDFNTAVRWGMAMYGGEEHDGRWSYLSQPIPDVLLAMDKPREGEPVQLKDYFLEHVTYATLTLDRVGKPANYHPPSAENQLPEWLIGGEWISFP